MPTRRRTGLWVFGIVGVAALAATAVYFRATGQPRQAGNNVQAAFDDQTPIKLLIPALRESDARALSALFQRTITPQGSAPKAFTGDELKDWVEAVKAIRTGNRKFGSYARASVQAVTARVLERIAVEPAPQGWLEILEPSHDLFASGLADADLNVRSQALMGISGAWGWVPGRPLTPAEEDAVADWKQGFNDPVVRRLADREPRVRAAAVACLGYNPLTSVASQAIPYLEDPESPEVRKQVLVSFAQRAALLPAEPILKHVYDNDPSIPPVAELILKSRGLTQEQISLGSMLYHPKPDIRVSLIPLLKDRTDVDPVVWLLQLSRDSEESVRILAVEALSSKLTPEVGKRLAEMAAKDPSNAVRQAAGRFRPEGERTAALPPLPGSPNLNPRAN